MVDVRPIQRGFASALRRPDARLPRALHRRPNGVSNARRFDVYRNNVYASLIDALKHAFPAVERLVGPDFFKSAARVFLEDGMPTQPTLIGFGEGFPEFLEQFEPARSLPYLADVARLELVWLRSYHASDAEPLAKGALSDIDAVEADDFLIEMHPAMQLLSSPFAVDQIWRTNREDAEVKPIDLGPGATHLLVFRPQAEVFLATLTVDEFEFLASLQWGGSLSAAAGAAAVRSPSFHLVTALAAAFDCGLIAGIKAVDARQTRS